MGPRRRRHRRRGEAGLRRHGEIPSVGRFHEVSEMMRHACNTSAACLNRSRARAGRCGLLVDVGRVPCRCRTQRRGYLTLLACAPPKAASQPWPPPVPWDGGAAFLVTGKFSLWWLACAFLALPLIDETLGRPLTLSERATLQLPLELAKAFATTRVVRRCPDCDSCPRS